MGQAAADRAAIAHRAIGDAGRDCAHGAVGDVGNAAVLDIGMGDAGAEHQMSPSFSARFELVHRR